MKFKCFYSCTKYENEVRTGQPCTPSISQGSYVLRTIYPLILLPLLFHIKLSTQIYKVTFDFGHGGLTTITLATLQIRHISAQ